MRTIDSNKLTSGYLKKLDRQNYLATAGMVLITTISLLWMLFRIGGGAVVTLFADSMYGVAELIGACLAFTFFYRARYGPLRLIGSHQLAWLLVSLGLLADSLGGFYFAYLEHNGILNPIPSLTDIGFTLFYLLAFVGLLLMPTTLRFRIRTALDALITTLCMLGLSWFFFIGPIYVAQLHNKVSLNTFVVGLSYPCWDMLLIFAIVLLIQRRAERTVRLSLLICGLGILSLIWADTAYAYFTALGTYTTGTPFIDTFWFSGAMLVGLSALYQYKAMVQKAYNKQIQAGEICSDLPSEKTGPKTATVEISAQKLPHRFTSLQRILIYLPYMLLIVLMLYSVLMREKGIIFLMVVLTAIVGLLVTLRYLLATYENEVLLQEQEQSQRKIEDMYQHLRLAHERLQELDRLKDQFMITASHELRTPLMAVQGYIELLTQYGDHLPNEQQREFLHKAERSCNELVLLLNNVIDASRLEYEVGIRTLQHERVGVQDIIESVVDLIGPNLKNEQRRVYHSIPPQLAVQADPMRLRQVLVNISTNALKYSPQKTPLTFSACAVLDEPRAVIISVTDKGKGICPQDQKRLFERFVRLESDINSSVRGSGLSLYISRRLIEAMDGTIWIESSGISGEGSTFHMKLPMAS